MKSDQEILADFESHVGDFLANTNDWRAESSLMYRFRDSLPAHVQNSRQQYEKLNYTRNQLNNRDGQEDRVLAVINLAAPYLRAIAGMFLDDSDEIEAYSVDPQFRGDADAMGDAMAWVQDESGFVSERTLAYEDALTRGVGATVSYLDFSNREAVGGLPRVDRKFFIYYDNSGRGSDINTRAAWCGYADPMMMKDLDEYMERNGVQKGTGYGRTSFFSEFMVYTDQENEHLLDFLYHYYWYEWGDVYDTENPYITRGEQLALLGERDPDVFNMLGAMSESLNVDLRSQFWALDKEGYEEAQAFIDNINEMLGENLQALSYSKRSAKIYYKAEIAHGSVIKKSRSFSQDCHAVNFIGGYFDETNGYHYGVMRPMAWVQELLNDAVGDYATYVHRTATGGNVAIKGAADHLKTIIQSKANEKQIFPVPGETEIIQLATPDAAQAMQGLVNFYVEMLPRSIGLPPEILGMLTTGDMTSALFGKVKRQISAVLSHFANNSANYLLNQGRIFVDMVQLIAETNDGQLIPSIAPGHSQQTYVNLSKQNISAKHSVRLVPAPAGPDERQEEFNKWSQLIPGLAPEAQIALMPMLIELSNTDEQRKQEALQRLQPQPQQPDPAMMATTEAQLRLINAQSANLEAGAQEKQASAADKAQEARLTEEEMLSVIDKNIAQAQKYRADALGA